MSRIVRTQVAIVGAGPAGLLLAHLLGRAGIASVVVETRSRTYVEGRVRAGVLEHGTADLLEATGVGARMRREGLVHRGIELQFAGRNVRLDLAELTGGKTVTVYGQQEVVKDLIEARVAANGALLFDHEVVRIEPDAGNHASIVYRDPNGVEGTVVADFVAGCDGFHGRSRAAIPTEAITLYDHVFPFAWLGILAEAPPVAEELIYANHERGFALATMRSRTISRHYVQVANDERLEEWPDDRIWSELRTRLACPDTSRVVVEGRVLQKGITPMRSFVCDPMRYGRLFLAGDSAHIVPPTGAKGMNLAVADVRVLASALKAYYATGDTEALDAYSETCLRRIWKTQRFSAYMTSQLHRFEADEPFQRKVRLAELDYVSGSPHAARSFAENYVGLPMDDAFTPVREPARTFSSLATESNG